MGFLLKTTEETYVYEEDAAVVAQTCIDVLGRLGKVTKVERDSGIILGKIKPKVFTDKLSDTIDQWGFIFLMGLGIIIIIKDIFQFKDIIF